MSNEIKSENVDVKNENQESSTEESKFSELEELFGAEKEQAIPYPRFKQVIEERNSLREKIQNLEQEYKSKMDEEVLKAKASKFFEEKGKQPSEEEALFEEFDDSTKKVKYLENLISELKNDISSIKQERAHENLSGKINSLKNSFEFMNETEVLAYAKMYPNKDLEELAEYSHKKNMEFISNKYNSYLEKKKKEADIQLTGPERIKTIKEKAKIESVDAAKKAMKSFLGVD